MSESVDVVEEKAERAPTKVMGDIGAELRERFVEYLEEHDVPMNVGLERAVKKLLDDIPVALHIAEVKISRDLRKVQEGGKMVVVADEEMIKVVGTPEGKPIVITNIAERDTLHSLLFGHGIKGYVLRHPKTGLEYMALMEAA